MTRILVIGLLLLAAPEETEGERILRIAYASQYEWKEDGVRNVTLEFAYRSSWKGDDKSESLSSGRGHVVVVGGKVERRHMPDASESDREQLAEHLDWVLRRFARPPFEEQFKEVVIGEPKEAAEGVVKIAAGSRVLLVKEGRLVGEEIDLGTPEQPFLTRVDYRVGEIGNGYGIVGTTSGYTRQTNKVSIARTLVVRKEGVPPSPQRYVYGEHFAGVGRREIVIDFDPPAVDRPEPVVIDSKARDLVRAAWQRRFTLPAEIRIEGTFKRDLDNDLKRLGWVAGVQGKFQVWGMDQISVEVESRTNGWRSREVQTTCDQHFTGFFRTLRPADFDKEFEGCGFEFAPVEGEGRIVRIYGYDGALAYRIEGGAIVGYLEAHNGSRWWNFKLKALKDGLLLIDRMSCRIEEQDYTLRFRYGKVRGHLVPKAFETLGLPRWGGQTSRVPAGVAEYKLNRLKVSLPD